MCGSITVQIDDNLKYNEEQFVPGVCYSNDNLTSTKQNRGPKVKCVALRLSESSGQPRVQQTELPIMSDSNKPISRVTHLYHGDRWVWLKTTLKGVTSQSVLRSDDENFPTERVEKWLTDDKRIVFVGYGLEDKTYVIISHRYDFDQPRVGKQEIFVSQDFPEQKIRDAWTKNSRVNILTYCKTSWVLITEENSSNVVGQSLSTWDEIEDVKAEVGKLWKADKKVETLVHGKINGQWKWVLLGQKTDGKGGGQTFYVNSDWPMDKISDYYKNKKYITTLAWNQPEEYWVLICGPVAGGQSLSTTGDFPSEKLQQMENLYFYGKRD